jgi:ribosomal protein S18 acetylase RimI-like enzyme
MLENMAFSKYLTCRLAREDDAFFLEQLFRYTRDDLYQLSMHKAFIDKLVSQQYQLQQASYRRQTPDVKIYVIEAEKIAVGKIMLHFDVSFIHIVDFSFLPAKRGQGFGTIVLQSIQNIARHQKSAVKLSVDRMNLSAKKLYLSSGFVVSGANETHETLVWSAA